MTVGQGKGLGIRMLSSGGYSGLDVKDRAPVDVPFHEAYEYKSFYKGLVGCIRESFNVLEQGLGR